jgi:hypothetical protein
MRFFSLGLAVSPSMVAETVGFCRVVRVASGAGGKSGAQRADDRERAERTLRQLAIVLGAFRSSSRRRYDVPEIWK